MVPDSLVRQWVEHLPGEDVVLVSLLGRKPNKSSEFLFYSFYGKWDSPKERSGKVSFEEWLAREYKERSICLIQHPTNDYVQIPQETLEAIKLDIFEHLPLGHTVILFDSGGVTRTGKVCPYMQFVEDSTTLDS